MQLNKFTDFGLRLLMLLAQPRNDLMTIAQAAKLLQVSENHLIKITHFMAKQGWIISTRGKGGGIRIAPTTHELRLGDMVRILENSPSVVNCNEPACVLRFACTLKSILDQALAAFYQYLNQFQFKDMLAVSSQLNFKQTDALAQLIPIIEIDASSQ